jgi:hypothetical protein
MLSSQHFELFFNSVFYKAILEKHPDSFALLRKTIEKNLLLPLMLLEMIERSFDLETLATQQLLGLFFQTLPLGTLNIIIQKLSHLMTRQRLRVDEFQAFINAIHCSSERTAPAG